MLDLHPYWCMSWELGFVSFNDAEFQWLEVSTVACSQLPTPAGSSSFRITSPLSFFFLVLVKEPSWYHTFVGVPYTTVFCVKSAASFKFKSPIAFRSPSLPVQMVCSRCSSELFCSQWCCIKNWAIFNTHRHMRAHTRMYLCVYIALTGSGVTHCW